MEINEPLEMNEFLKTLTDRQIDRDMDKFSLPAMETVIIGLFGVQNMKINEFLKTLTYNQIDRLMEIMDKFSLSVTEAVIIGFNEIKSAK